MNPDVSLLNELQQASTKETAFQTLVKTYQRALYAHIRRMVANHDDTDDVLQNTFILVWKNIDKFRGESALKTWLYRIATNEAVSFLNKKQKRNYSDVSELEKIAQHSETSAFHLSAEEIQARLQTAIQRLPEKQKLVFNLRYFDELSFREISEILETSEGGLKANYHHALKKIETFLTQGEWIYDTQS